ncbi:MAG: secretion system protein E [Nitrospiraceae bacterium]|nr:MAG: secretion system protein E [Nitrospiraceae bacterium]
MYTNHFGLKTLPFENVPDPKFFFDEGEYHRIRSRVTDSLKAGRGLIIVTGPIGSGKTTLSQMIKADYTDHTKLIWIAEPPANSMDLFIYISQELGIASSVSERVFLLRDIKDALLKSAAKGLKCLLMIDESHLITDDVLNGIRLLNNLEEGSTKLIQIFLLGQEEFMDKIKRPEMEPFKQRIATLEILGKMNSSRIREYIAHRLHVAGGSPSIFSDTGWEAVAIAFSTGGAPRVVNSLCDRSLHAAFERNKTTVDTEDVYKAAKDMGIGQEVFHYIVKLKNAGRKQQEPPAVQKVPLKEPVVSGQDTDPSFSGASNYAGSVNEKKPVSKKPSLKIPGNIFTVPEKDVKDLRIPALLLLLSIVLFISSIFYYCHRSGSSSLIDCLFELISG